VYYHHDQRGNELGHFVRVSSEGGAPQDVTPALQPYPTFGMCISRAGHMVAFTLADATGYHLCCILLGAEAMLAAPRLNAQGKHPAVCQALSYGGDIAVMVSTERTGTLRGRLVALDTTSGRRIGTLWDGPGSSLEASDSRRLRMTSGCSRGPTGPAWQGLCCGIHLRENTPIWCLMSGKARSLQAAGHLRADVCYCARSIVPLSNSTSMTSNAVHGTNLAQNQCINRLFGVVP
jgi:hypothetical protein